MPEYEPTYHDDIAAAYNAISVIGELDRATLSESEKRKIDQIKTWSITLIHNGMKKLIESEFGEKKTIE